MSSSNEVAMQESGMFSCSYCGREYPIETREFRCSCGGAFRLHWTPKPIHPSALRGREPSIWRYREGLPIDEEGNIVSMGEGFTPLIPFPYRDFKGISLKLDYLCPTGSFKDRGVSVFVSKMKELGISQYLGESSGNAGASLAAYTTRAGIECRMFCPATISEGKLIQMKAYGAQVTKIPGSRADTTVAVQQEAKRCYEESKSSYYSPQTWNPFFLEGIKTLSFEISEQLGWDVPDAVICPVGYGTTYLGLYRGFTELLEQGIVEKHPRLIGIQAEAIAPIYEAFSRKAVEVDEVPRNETMAEGIACVRPNRGKEILEIAGVTEGCFEIVSEGEIIEGWRELNRQGIYVEPTSAVVVRAMDRLKHRGLLEKGENIVLILTGSGLKATEKLGGYVNA